MIVKLLVIYIIIFVCFLYLLGVNKNKTDKDIEKEDKEQMEYLKNYSCRRRKNDKQSKKK